MLIPVMICEKIELEAVIEEGFTAFIVNFTPKRFNSASNCATTVQFSHSLIEYLKSAELSQSTQENERRSCPGVCQRKPGCRNFTNCSNLRWGSDRLTSFVGLSCAL